MLGSYLGCHPSCDDFYNGVRFSLSLCWGLTLADTPLVTISTHWVVQTSSSKPLTFLPCIFIVSGSADDKILWATSSSWNSTRCSKNINHQISVVFLSTVKICSAYYFYMTFLFMECFSAFLHFCTFMYLFFDCVKGGIRHLLILMWIQLHYNKNNFTVLEFLNFSIFDPPKKVLKFLER